MAFTDSMTVDPLAQPIDSTTPQGFCIFSVGKPFRGSGIAIVLGTNGSCVHWPIVDWGTALQG